MRAHRTPLLFALLLASSLLPGCRWGEVGGLDSGAPENTFTPGSQYGTWLADDGENEILMLTFFDDGTVLHAEYDAEEAGDEPSGMEWTPLTIDDAGVVTLQDATFDGNGSTGLTDFVGSSDLQLEVEGTTLTLHIIGGDDAGASIPFTRLESVGAQGTFRTTETENELLAFTFLPGGTYCHFEYDDAPGDEVNGMECAEYTLGTDDVMTVTADDVLVDNNGDTGLTDFIGTTDLKVTFTEAAMTAAFALDDGSTERMSFDRLP